MKTRSCVCFIKFHEGGLLNLSSACFMLSRTLALMYPIGAACWVTFNKVVYGPWFLYRFMELIKRNFTSVLACYRYGVCYREKTITIWITNNQESCVVICFVWNKGNRKATTNILAFILCNFMKDFLLSCHLIVSFCLKIQH